jgi:hypothetical protein
MWTANASNSAESKAPKGTITKYSQVIICLDWTAPAGRLTIFSLVVRIAMKNLIRLEELFFFLFSIFLFRTLDYAWWWYPVLLLAPDAGMIGYLVNPRVGALTYNLTHHKAIALTAYILGALTGSQLLQLVGVIVLGHSSLDRVLGYGLKHLDSFQHTHLGWLGRASE